MFTPCAAKTSGSRRRGSADSARSPSAPAGRGGGVVGAPGPLAAWGGRPGGNGGGGGGLAAPAGAPEEPPGLARRGARTAAAVVGGQGAGRRSRGGIPLGYGDWART